MSLYKCIYFASSNVSSLLLYTNGCSSHHEWSLTERFDAARCMLCLFVLGTGFSPSLASIPFANPRATLPHPDIYCHPSKVSVTLDFGLRHLEWINLPDFSNLYCWDCFNSDSWMSCCVKTINSHLCFYQVLSILTLLFFILLTAVMNWSDFDGVNWNRLLSGGHRASCLFGIK